MPRGRLAGAVFARVDILEYISRSINGGPQVGPLGGARPRGPESGMDGFEYELWREVFEEARRAYSALLHSPGDWERVKRRLAEALVRSLARRFHTIRRAALADLSGGECASDSRPSLDIDLLILVESPAEAYALRQLEPLLDNALREAFIHTKTPEDYRRLALHYRRGLHHNILELHVNDTYARSRLHDCPPIELLQQPRTNPTSPQPS